MGVGKLSQPETIEVRKDVKKKKNYKKESSFVCCDFEGSQWHLCLTNEMGGGREGETSRRHK